MKLIVGLGNPGLCYQNTRHNAGYRVVEELAREPGFAGWVALGKSLVAVGALAGAPVALVRPLTYMNGSGNAVRLLLDEYQLETSRLVVIYDDLDLPLGRIRIRERGSAGGHHGMESILRVAASEEFIRVRLGIGEENMPEDKAGFVLAEVPPGRAADWNDMMDRAARAVTCIVADGVSRAMSLFNA